MTDTAKILIVDDDEDILTAARLVLRRRFGEIVTCRRPEEIPDLILSRRYYQANIKSIQIQDEMLGSLLDIKT